MHFLNVCVGSKKILKTADKFKAITSIFMLCILATVQNSFAKQPSAEEMWEIIQQQQILINELKARLDDTEQRVTVNEEKTAEAAEELDAAAEAFEIAQLSSHDLPHGSSRLGETSIGGYGEIHYNNLSDNNDTVGGDDALDRVDLHRLVVFFSHAFTDNIRIFSEFEIEHALAGDGEPGAVEVEQVWVELDMNDHHRFRAGIDILPLGILNLTHEPNTFYGVERNRIETEIIPVTWWEVGVGFNGEIAPGWNYDIFAHGGLVSPTTGSSTLRPRSGRTKIAQADNQDIAYTGRIRYTGMLGLEIGLSGQYQSDMTGTADAFDVNATLFEGHIDYKHATGFALRALYARWDIDVPTDITFAQDSLDGWYIEPAYRFVMLGGISGELGIFTRYAQWDERGQGNLSNGTFIALNSWSIGVNWWPHPNVVFKFDYQNEGGSSNADAIRDGINLGFGYEF